MDTRSHIKTLMVSCSCWVFLSLFFSSFNHPREVRLTTRDKVSKSITNKLNDPSCPYNVKGETLDRILIFDVVSELVQFIIW